MPDFDFDEPIDRTDTASLKWDHYAGRDIIPLWVADMDFRSPPVVAEALAQRIEQGVFGYGVVPGRLAELTCEMLAARYDWQVEPHQLVWLPGLVCGLNIACRTVGAQQDDVITMVPIYPPFLTAPGNSKRQLITVPLVVENQRWVMDFNALVNSITPKTRLLLFCNPHNPTGRVFSRRELEKLTAVCLDHKITICSDEIHCDLILDSDKEHIPTATISQEVAENTITLMAPSKTFNIPGLGCSFAVILNPELRAKFLQVMTGIVPQVNIFGFTAAESAYRNGWEWLAALLEYLRENSRLVEEEVNSLEKLSMQHVEATYLAWIDARRIDKKQPARYFESCGIGLSEGRDFGAPGFVRLNFGCRRVLLKQALERLRAAAA